MTPPFPKNTSALIERALASLAEEEDALCADLARLVACDTSFPPGAGYAAFAELMEGLLRPLGFATQRIEVPEKLWRAPGSAEPRINLVAERGGGRPVCSLYYQLIPCRPARAGPGHPCFSRARAGGFTAGARRT